MSKHIRDNNRILLVTQYFHPENFKSNDIAFELQKKGYMVDVLTGIPNYPQGVFFKGYGVFRKRFEVLKGVNVYRAFQFPRGRKHSNVLLSINYLSFALFSLLWLLLLGWRNYKCIIVHQTSPITQALSAVILAKIKKVPMYLWVLDIWPDAMSSGGGIKNKKILKLINIFVTWVYDASKKILISSRDFKDLVLRNGNFSHKIVYFPNWAENIQSMPIIEGVPKFPGDFKIMMAGNLGSAQTIPAVLETIKQLSPLKAIKWIFVGDGSARQIILDFIENQNLEEYVFAIGRVPKEHLPALYAQADAMLITLRANYPHLKAVVPARLQSYMSSGKPIIGMIDGGSANLIKEANCGYCVGAEDSEALANVIENKILPNKDEFFKLGKNGHEFYETNFTVDKCMNNLENLINEY